MKKLTFWFCLGIMFFGYVEPAFAHNCSGLKDCYNVAKIAAIAVAAITILGSLLLDFSPLGRVKGITEAILGRDLITGAKLEWWERLLNLIPGGKKVGKAIDAAGDATAAGKKISKNLKISTQKQAGHVKGTSQYKNRVKQGKSTSVFENAQDAERYTIEAWEKGTPVKGRPNVKEYDFGRPIGTGPKGGTQNRVRVHIDKEGRIHGHPSGRENFDK